MRLSQSVSSFLAPVALALGLGVVPAAQPAQAAETFAIDLAHSNIVFLIDHLGYSRMIGQFQDFEGSFVFDEADVTKSTLSVTVQTASVDTDHEARDNHLRSPDFFNAAEFPEMTFKSTAIERTGDNTGKITGDLTLLGTTKPVTLEVTFRKKAPHPVPQYNGVLVAGFSARTSIQRSEWGMKTFVPSLGDEIEIWIEIEGHQK